MDQIPQAADPQIAANRPGVRLVRHRATDHAAHGGDGVRPFQRDGGDRPGSDELDQAGVEVLAGMDRVMALGERR